MKERPRGFAQRSKKGSLVFWFLIIAVIGLTLVVGLVFLELLIRGVSLARVQNAANEAALVYARDMVRLRDEALSRMNLTTADFASANLPTSCSATGGCTPATGKMAAVQGAVSMEYANASQTFLYNIWGARVSDPSMVDDVRQNQCYKAHNESRFSKIPSSPINNCAVTNRISSPIMSLTWSLQASPYGTGVCCSAGGNDGTKDFCVDFGAAGRMDPVIAGGLPFLTGAGAFDSTAMAANGRRPLNPVRFITVGDFEIHARAVVMRMDSREVTGDDKGFASNLSGETIGLEAVPAGATCGAPALTVNPPNPFTPPTSPYMPPPPQPPLPPDEVVNLTNPPYTPSSPLDPGCPPSYVLDSVLSQSSTSISYSCKPPCSVPRPVTFNTNGISGECQTAMLMFLNTQGYSQFRTSCAAWSPKEEETFNKCGFTDTDIGGQRGNCVMKDGEIIAENYEGACYCPIVLSLSNKDLNFFSKFSNVQFAFEKGNLKKHLWINPSREIGFLAYDFNSNGFIDGGNELFGQFTDGKSFKNGYEALSLLDKNHDGKLAGNELDGIIFWSDMNSDGKSQPSEMVPLKVLSIKALFIKEGIELSPKRLGKGLAYPYFRQGFERMTDGGLVYGSTYDLWFPEVLPSALKDDSDNFSKKDSFYVGLL